MNLKRFLQLSLLCLALFGAGYVYAKADIYSFTSDTERSRFQTLTSELRCLVCQNQNIAESNAGLAKDLRDHIYQQILQGHTDQDITDYLVHRYGDYILYKPPVTRETLALWIAPLCILLLGIAYLFIYISRKPKEPPL